MKGFTIKNKLLAAFVVLALVSLIPVGIVSVYSMENAVIKNVLEKAKADSATGLEIIDRTYPGQWTLKDGKLYKGSQAMNDNFSIVDRIAELTGSAITVFQEDTRVATTVKKDGQRAVGTTVDPKVAETVLKNGQPYYGEAPVVGVMHQTVYQPIHDGSGKVIGIWFVGVSKKSLDEAIYDFIIKMFITGAITLLFAGILAWSLAGTLSKPIFRLKEVMEKAGAGDLTHAADIGARDEIGILATSFNQMSVSFRDTLGNFISASSRMLEEARGFSANADNLARSNQEVNIAIEEVARGNSEQTQDIAEVVKTMDKLSESIGSISEGAERQAENVNRASSVIGEMVGGIEEVASSAMSAAKTAEDTAEVANQGGAAVEQVVSGMENIKAKVFEAANRIKELGDHSQQIGEIVQVIDGIAEQTNLLALNAAIEAARAGEHGKGFAVVADEVRKLAERSSKATKEIAELVNTIQQGTEKAVSAMEEGKKEVETGAGLAVNAGDALGSILNNVSKTNDEIHKISRAAQYISEQSAEVVAAMDNVAMVTEENFAATHEMMTNSAEAKKSVQHIAHIAEMSAAAAQEVTASSEQMYSTSEMIASTSKELAQVAEELRNQAGRFKV